MKNYISLPGNPDIAITKHTIAIFCDSVFFHGKNWDELKLLLEGGKNSTYWIKKITRNMEREIENGQALRFWGKDIVKHTVECVKAVDEVVLERMMAEQWEDLE